MAHQPHQHRLQPLMLEDEQKIGVAALVLALAGMVSGWLVDSSEGSDVLGFLIFSVLLVAVAAYVFWRFIPHVKASPDPRNRPVRDGLFVSSLGLITLIVFWTGLPIVLGAAGFALGRIGEQRSETQGRRGRAIAAMLIGALAVALAVAVFVVDEVS